MKIGAFLADIVLLYPKQCRMNELLVCEIVERVELNENILKKYLLVTSN